MLRQQIPNDSTVRIHPDDAVLDDATGDRWTQPGNTLSCTDAASETSPEITIHHYRWDATALFTAAAALALAGTVVALRAERKQELITESQEDRART
jgi:hypothetical protein